MPEFHDVNDNRTRRVIFLNRYFHPDHSATSQMLSDLAFSLAARGHHVEVIASRQRYDEPNASLPAREVHAGVRIRRVATTRFGRGTLPGRAVDYLTFYVTAAWALMVAGRRGDIVVAKTDPPLLCIAAGPIARLRGAALVNWLQDIFPDVAQATGLGRGRIARLAFRGLGMLRNRALRIAAANVVIGERMGAKLTALAIDPRRVRVIPNWTDGSKVLPVAPDRNPLRAEWGLSGAFVIGYSGNLGRVHDYVTFLDAIAMIEARQAGKAEIGGNDGGTASPHIRWLFIGGGASFRALQAETARRALVSVQFRGYQCRDRLAESLSVPDVHLVSLSPELEGLVVPSKYYGIAAAGRAAIFVGDTGGEIARSLARSGSGYTVAPGDATGLANLIVELSRNGDHVRRLGRNARETFEQNFDLNHAIAAWEDLLSDIAPPLRSARPEVTVPLGSRQTR